MNKFSINGLYTLVKRSIDNADLESLLTMAPADVYDFESREIAEHLAAADNAATIDDLTSWLLAYWSRQFEAMPTEEWLASRDFRRLAAELIEHRETVDSPEAKLRYQSWLCSPAFAYAETNGELLDLVRTWTVELAGQIYGRWATGAQHDGTEAECEYAERRLQRVTNALSYGETRRMMLHELLAFCMKVDARGYLSCFRGESHKTGVGKPAEESEADALLVQLRDCVSLYVESVLIQPAPHSGCDSGSLHSAGGNNSFN